MTGDFACGGEIQFEESGAKFGCRPAKAQGLFGVSFAAENIVFRGSAGFAWNSRSGNQLGPQRGGYHA
jgi:hypothetical protein